MGFALSPSGCRSNTDTAYGVFTDSIKRHPPISLIRRKIHSDSAMRRAYSAVLSLLVILGAGTAHADSTWEFSVQASASVQTNPAQITLQWPQDTYLNPNSYTVFRKSPGATSWGAGSVLPGTATNYIDSRVSLGAAYEYQIVKNTSHYTGYGYVYAGINLPPTESRGKLLLIVDNTHALSLSNELARLHQDLVGDGWIVSRMDVNRDDSVAAIKSRIKEHYRADPANLKALFLLGHVPVPYSGDIVPDGHVPDHQGAWPCDGFYGDMDGTWTDNSVNDSVATEARTRNVPGDGKYDQSSFPAPIKLMVGRVDLANLPGRLTWGGAATFPSELELLRNYLNKDHQFRQKQFDLPRRSFVGDYFGYRNGEAFAASGWRNLSAFFSATNIVNLPAQGTWLSTLSTNPCLAAYGCGAGSYTSIGGLGNSDVYHDGITTELMANDPKTVFAMLFGSWLGDWDSEDNILRSVLALPSYGLASAWSGRPHWFMHHMALGEPIGFSARLTQNNTPKGLYQNQLNSCAGQIHIALMGDPTLRLHIVAPASNLQGWTNENGMTLTWTASQDSVAGYHIYRAADPAGPFLRLTDAPVLATSFADVNAAGTEAYMVRAIKLETSASGTYYNLSQGAFLNGTSLKWEAQPAVPNLTAVGRDPRANRAGADQTFTNQMLVNAALSNALTWVDDALPPGSVGSADGGDSWHWVSKDPAPVSGKLASQSNLGDGLHQHYFSWASPGLAIGAGDFLFAYVHLDPTHMPSELMLQWNDGTWDHRAYWGANRIIYGRDGTNGRRHVGPLPAPGRWVRLQVPAAAVGLEGRIVTGMAFTLFDGQATWDDAGKLGSATTVADPALQRPAPQP